MRLLPLAVGIVAFSATVSFVTTYFLIKRMVPRILAEIVTEGIFPMVDARVQYMVDQAVALKLQRYEFENSPLIIKSPAFPARDPIGIMGTKQ